jgi:hypothetical protein
LAKRLPKLARRIQQITFLPGLLGMDEELSRKHPPLQGAQLDWKLFIY